MIQPEPYLPGVPILRPLRSAGVVIPDDALANTTFGNFA